MDFFIFTLLNVVLTLLALFIYDGITLRRFIKNSISSDVPKYTPKEDSLENEENIYSSYEIEKKYREKIFDERIALLKQEIGVENRSAGYTAEELDPNVYNLPHDSVTSLINADADEVSQ